MSAGTTAAPVPSTRPRIMVVDDQDSLREAMCEMLVDAGMSVVRSASDGTEAVALAEDGQVDVVLMDLRMPMVDGVEATRLIKEQLPLTQVIIYSAYDDPGLRRSADEVGAYCYLVKGCRPQLVCEMVQMAWGYRRGLERG